MEKALIDTNILSYFLDQDAAIVEQFRCYRQYHSYLSFSIFTYYETKSGLLYRDARNKMKQFERLAEIINYDQAIADISSQIYSSLRSKGFTIPPIDLFISATAISRDYTLITANVKDIQNIPGLRYENWVS